MYSYISEREGIDCDNMPKRRNLRHEVLWRYEGATGILLPWRHVNVMALEVKDFWGVIYISRLVQGNRDDVKGLRPECWAIVDYSDGEWHVIDGTAEIIESDPGCAGAHLVEA
jgi:hypothetical protein